MAGLRAVNPHCFEPPIAPHIAAAEAGDSWSSSAWSTGIGGATAGADIAVVEGAGGWRVPLHPTGFLSDLPEQLGLGVIIVVGLTLGCLSHARLTAEAILASGRCPLLGWIGNCHRCVVQRQQQNLSTLERLLGAPPLAVVTDLSAAPRSPLGMPLAHLADDVLLGIGADPVPRAGCNSVGGTNDAIPASVTRCDRPLDWLHSGASPRTCSHGGRYARRHTSPPSRAPDRAVAELLADARDSASFYREPGAGHLADSGIFCVPGTLANPSYRRDSNWRWCGGRSGSASDAGRQREIIVVSPDSVVLERRGLRQSIRMVFPRHWATVKLRDPPVALHPSRLVIESKGYACEVGRFLTEDERRGLAGRLGQLVGRMSESPEL